MGTAGAASALRRGSFLPLFYGCGVDRPCLSFPAMSLCIPCPLFSQVRQAAAAWLLGLLKHRGDSPAVREAAGDVQRGLVGLLADANEATQVTCTECCHRTP